MKKILLGFAASLGILGLAATALANSSRLKINAIEVSVGAPNPAVAVQFTSIPDGRPSCASTYNSATVSLDPSVSADTTKALTALATSAFLSGKSVIVAYSASCINGNNPLINDIVVTN